MNGVRIPSICLLLSFQFGILQAVAESSCIMCVYLKRNKYQKKGNKIHDARVVHCKFHIALV